MCCSDVPCPSRASSPRSFFECLQPVVKRLCFAPTLAIHALKTAGHLRTAVELHFLRDLTKQLGFVRQLGAHTQTALVRSLTFVVAPAPLVWMVLQARGPSLFLLPARSWWCVSPTSRYRHFHAGDCVVRQGEKGTNFFIILSGAVGVFIHPPEAEDQSDDSAPADTLDTECVLAS